MNKYQETLNGMDGIKMLIKVVLVECEFIKDLYNEELDRLRELVDKATPYKVDKYQMTNFGAVGNCICGKKANDIQRYCMHCGQALDWNKD